MKVVFFLLSLAMATPTAAAVIDVQPNGFQVTSTAAIAATPSRVYQALVDIGAWWDKDHTFSNEARSLKLDARAGGCFCETLPSGGSVLHMTVVYADPGKELRLRGALGPLQPMGLEGALELSIKPAAGGSQVVLSYAAGGYAPGGLAALAGPVDGVLTAQLGRLKSYVETGKPAP